MGMVCRSFFIAFLVAIPTAAVLGIFAVILFVALSSILPEENVKNIISAVWGLPLAYSAYGIAFVGTLVYTIYFGRKDQ